MPSPTARSRNARPRASSRSAPARRTKTSGRASPSTPSPSEAAPITFLIICSPCPRPPGGKLVQPCVGRRAVWLPERGDRFLQPAGQVARSCQRHPLLLHLQCRSNPDEDLRKADLDPHGAQRLLRVDHADGNERRPCRKREPRRPAQERPAAMRARGPLWEDPEECALLQ